MSHLVQPRAFVQPGRIDDERGVVLPVADGVAIEARLWRAPDVDLLWKRPSVREDLTPHALLLIPDEDAVRRRPDERSAPGGDRMRKQVARKAERIAGDERVVRLARLALRAASGELRRGAVSSALLEGRLACRRHGRYGVRLVGGGWPHPGSGQIPFRRGAGWVWHLRDAFRDESLATDPLTALRRRMGDVRHDQQRRHHDEGSQNGVAHGVLLVTSWCPRPGRTGTCRRHLPRAAC